MQDSAGRALSLVQPPDRSEGNPQLQHDIPLGLLTHKSVTVTYGGVEQKGILCMVTNDVHGYYYARFLNVLEREASAGEKGSAEEPWTLLHPTMGLTWIQVSRITRIMPVLSSGECSTFVAFVDDIDAYIGANNLGAIR